MVDLLPVRLHSVINRKVENASFAVIIFLLEGLTHIQSQIKPQLLFGESFTLTSCPEICLFLTPVNISPRVMSKTTFLA